MLLIRFFSAALVVTAALAWSVGFGPLAYIGYGVAAILSTAIFPRRELKRANPRQSPRKRSRRGWLTHLFHGGFAGVGAILLLICASSLRPSLAAVVDYWHDRDRHLVEATLSGLEQDGKWSDATMLIVQRLERPTSTTWHAALSNRLFRDRLEAISQSDAYATNLSDLVGDRDRTPLECKLIQGVSDSEQLLALRDALIVQQKESLTRLQDAEREHATTDLDIAELFEQHPGVARAWLDRGSAVAARNSTPVPGLEKAISTWMPARDLPPDTCVSLIAQRKDGLVASLDLSVAQHDQFVEGLTTRDFAVWLSDRPFTQFVIEPVFTTIGDLHVAVLFDFSASTAGEPNAQALRGMREFLTSLPANCFHRAWAFASDVQAVTNWSASVESTLAHLTVLRPNGPTAMLRALDIGTLDLTKQREARALVLFTDGKDSVGGVSVESVVNRCQQAHIAVYAVSLVTRDADPETLARICRATGGEAFSADSPDALISAFRSVARSLQRRAYRMTVLRPTGETGSFRINVGRRNEAILDVTL